LTFKLSREERNKLIQEIQTFFQEERDEEIGIVAGGIVLDFFLERLGPQIYNKALDDARVWYMKKMEDLEFDFDSLYKGGPS
jgi:uncharacterized protein (DUF2164 family)